MKLMASSSSHKRPRLISSCTNKQQQQQSLQDFRQTLPVYPYKQQLLQAMIAQQQQPHDNNKVVLVSAQTGSGKSTQIPAYLLQHYSDSAQNNHSKNTTKHMNNHYCIAVTQPRRVAAMTLAQRVAHEHGSELGQCIGYRVRFEECCPSPHVTHQLLYMTDGMLLRQAMTDPLLTAWDAIFLDECHERSWQSDILLGIVQQARLKRANLMWQPPQPPQQQPAGTAAEDPLHSTNPGRSRHNTTTTTNSRIRPLTVVVMSATLEMDTFGNYFGGPDNVTMIQIPGRQYPVQLLYTNEPVVDYIEAALYTTVQIHEHEAPGDILVFLPGQEEIEDLARLLRDYLQHDDNKLSKKTWTGDRIESMQSHHHHNNSNSNRSSQQLVGDGVLICVLYAALPAPAQRIALEPKPAGCTRKIILATNIAETSLTLPDIRYVVDTGKHKSRHVSTSTGMESLTIQNVSQAQAAQRAGRCGRVQAGICFRLYTQQSWEHLPVSTPPEILRIHLSQVVLSLKGMGVTDPTQFAFVTPPDRSSLVRATQLLYALGALDDQMELTGHGTKLAKLPLDPVFGNLLLKSAEYSCTKEMLTAVSVLSAENLFYRPSSSSESAVSGKAAAAHARFASHEGDLPTFLNVYSAWQNEAVFVASSAGAVPVPTKRIQQQSSFGHAYRGKLPHGEWCRQNYISGRCLVQAYHIRGQLLRLVRRPVAQHGLGMDPELSCGTDRPRFLKCVAAGMFLQVASRIPVDHHHASSSSSGSGTVALARGRYRTKLGNEIVSIHPTSTMFGRQPAPACVVYSEVVTTKRTYIRGVTQIKEEWLHEVAPNFYS